ATGARNESSVLFSLSALTSAASNPKPSVAPSSPGVTEDSGLIDLKALTAAAASVGDSPLAPQPGVPPAPLGAAPLGGAPLGGAPLGVAPLGGGMPVGGAATALALPMPPNQGKTRTGRCIAGGLVAAAVAVTLISQLTGGSKDDAAPSTAVAPAPVATIATADPPPEPEPK